MTDHHRRPRLAALGLWAGAGGAAAVLAAGLGGGAVAHVGATGVVKERMDLMMEIGDATKAIADMLRGTQPYDAERMRAMARRIEGHGGEAMTSLFPDGSLDHPSEALPAIWTEWERFERLADLMADQAGALARAADNPRGPMQRGGGMMGGSGIMSGSGMMGGGMMGGGGPSAEDLAAMPPDAAFRHLAQTCSACHEAYREEQ
ncbi:MAG: cytochrome c [Alphaproteobacteria bacterium]|nr:cytochrome c [Alphaproteobacteria bacterium]